MEARFATAGLFLIALAIIFTVPFLIWRLARTNRIAPLVMIVFASVLLDTQIITEETFTALLLMTIVSTLLTVPVVTPKLRRLANADI